MSTSPLSGFAGYFGADRVPERAALERERALKRGVIAVLISCVGAYQVLTGKLDHAWAIVLIGPAIAAASLGYRRYLQTHPDGGAAVQYLLLVLDPVLLVLVLIQDPKIFGLLNPLLLIVVIRSGLVYGVRTMYLAWGATLAAAVFMPTAPYWREEWELTFTFFLLLALVPAFFAGLIRRIHASKSIEADRARLIAMHEAVVARSAFLAKVSHELRSPLQSITSALDVMQIRQQHVDGNEDELIGRIRRASMLLNTQLRDLLTLARGEAGRLEVQAEPFDACAMIDALVKSVRELADAKGLELVVELPPTPVFVVADGARIDQVLNNLVVNSIRYTARGRVQIALHQPLPMALVLRFTVADTGPGIPAAVLPTLFAPDKALTGPERRGEGSGIGLAIVRTLVAHLHATIAVTSGDGEGTTFTLDVPVEPVKSDADSRWPEESTGRVLVVDDRLDVLESLSRVVDELGFECDRASTQGQASTMLAQRRYDLVMLDIEMPLRSGAEFASEIRHGSGPNRRTRLLGMSASGVPANVERHFDVCLVKPIDHAALRRALFKTGYGATRPSQPALWNDDASP